MTQMLIIIAAILVGVLGVIPLIVSSFLRNVEAGTIRMVSWLQGSTIIYRGPGKSKEVPLSPRVPHFPAKRSTSTSISPTRRRISIATALRSRSRFEFSQARSCQSAIPTP